MVNEARLLNTFLELVKVDSETKNERSIADVLKRKFTALGLEVFEDDSATRTGHGAGNLICHLKGNKTGVDPVLFNCHMDTVKPGNGIKPVVKNGYIQSDGTTILGADCKAGVAALLETVSILQENQVGHGDIQFVITAGEEMGLVGAKALDPTLLRAKYGFALDADCAVGSMNVAAPTRVKLTVEIHGKSAHAGLFPEKGVSAAMIAGKAIATMPHGRIDFETTANIGTLEGKSSLNVVCDYVLVEAEVRSLEMSKMEAAVAEIKQTFESAAAEFGGRIVFEKEVLYVSFKFTEADEIVQIAQRAATRIGRKSALFEVGGGSDANAFNGYGVPTVILGVGFDDVHTKVEKIAVAELNKMAEMTLAVVSEVAGE